MTTQVHGWDIIYLSRMGFETVALFGSSALRSSRLSIGFGKDGAPYLLPRCGFAMVETLLGFHLGLLCGGRGISPHKPMSVYHTASAARIP